MEIKNIAAAMKSALRGKKHVKELEKDAPVPTGAQIRRHQRNQSRFYAKQSRRARIAQINRERRQAENGHISTMKAHIIAGDTTVERTTAGSPPMTVEVELDITPAMQRNIERDLVARLHAQATEQVRSVEINGAPDPEAIQKLVHDKLTEMGLSHLAVR